MWRFACTLDEADGRTAFLAAKEGDSAAQRVLDEYIGALGEGIANVVNMLRPQAIIIGGGISAEGEALLEPLRRVVRARILVSEKDAPLALVCASLGNDAGLYGAAQYAFDRL